MKRPLVLPLLLLAVAFAGCGSDDAAPAVDESDKPGIYLTAAEAEAAQFRGAGEGAEQIGSALLFVDPEVDPETEDVLKTVEGCLAEL